MCAVSMVSDYYTKIWPERFPAKADPWRDPEIAKMLKDIIERLDKVDKKLNDIECNEESKTKFLKDIGANI